MAVLTRKTVFVTAIGLVVALVVAGCVSASKKQSSSPGPSVTLSLPLTLPSSFTPSASVDPRQAAERAALTAYRNMWQAYVDALAVPNPHDPKLALYATGHALRTLTTGVGKAQAQGLKGTGTMVVRPEVLEVIPEAQPTRVEITDCVDTSVGAVVRISPGVPYSDPPGGLRYCRAAAQLQADGSWKVTDFGLHEVGSCI